MKGKFSEAISESFRKGKNEGRAEGRNEGLIEGAIKEIVLDCMEEDKTFPDAVNKIIRRLSLPVAEAEQMARLYWNA